MDGLLTGEKECLMCGTPMTAPYCKVLRTFGYLCTRLCLSIKLFHPLSFNGVTGLVRRSARAVCSAVLLGSAS
jgi:hypothetical protein